MEWHERLAKRVKELGWKNTELARRAGVSYDRVNKYMRGDVEHPRGDVVKKLADAIGVSEQYLYFGVEKKIQSGDDTSFELSMRRAPLYAWGELFMLDIVNQTAPAALRSLAVPEDDVGKLAFYVEAPDDSNAPVFHEGDKLLCDPDSPATPGKFIIAIINGHKTPVFGRYRVKGMENGEPTNIEIVPADDHFPVIRVARMADMRILGRIVYRLSSV